MTEGGPAPAGTPEGATVSEAVTQTQAAPAPKPVPPNPQEWAKRLVAALPELREVREELELVLLCDTRYADPERRMLQLPREMALKQLQVTGVTTEGDLRSAIRKVWLVRAAAWEALTRSFIKATTGKDLGEAKVKGLDPKTVDVRFQEEVAEQQGLTARADDLLQYVRDVCLLLGIPFPAEPQAAPAPPAPPSPTAPAASREGGSGRILQFGGRGLGFLGSLAGLDLGQQQEPAPQAAPAQATPVPVVDPFANANWLTPPVLSEDDEDIQILTLVIKPLVDPRPDPSQAWAWMEPYGLDRPRVTQILGSVAKKARDQKRQSDRVQANIRADLGNHFDQLNELQELSRVLDRTQDFFFPDEGETQAPA